MIQADGIWEPKDTDSQTDIVQWLQDGSWVDYTEVPMVRNYKNGTVLAAADAFFDLIGANIVNYSWRDSKVYLSCYEMTEDDCKYNLRCDALQSITVLETNN